MYCKDCGEWWEECKCDDTKKPHKVTVIAIIDFEITADNYVNAFNEAIQSIEIKHKGYRRATYR